ncbi:MAG: GNAT family N-acetyltransferase [Pikeienuella sp.]
MAQDYTITPPIPGDIGWLVGLHGRWYAENYGFGVEFEGIVAAIAGDIMHRLSPPHVTMRVARDNEGPLATLSCDLEDTDAAGRGHIRIVIAEPRARGRGIATKLLQLALDDLRSIGAPGAYLNTFKGLDAAKNLYLSAGFQLAKEAAGETWGVSVTEQRYEIDFNT